MLGVFSWLKWRAKVRMCLIGHWEEAFLLGFLGTRLLAIAPETVVGFVLLILHFFLVLFIVLLLVNVFQLGFFVLGAPPSFSRLGALKNFILI